MATPKQEKLIRLLMASYGKVGETRHLKDILMEAGYSEESAKNPKIIIEGEAVQEGLEEFLKSMNDKRKLAITHITEKKLEAAPARELAYVSDLLTKNIQLLNGGKTSNEGMEISWE